MPDPDVLHKAADLGRILVSHDRKTMPAHFARFLDSRPSPVLITVPQDLDIGLGIEDLPIIWAASDAEEWTDKVGFLPW